MGVNGVAAARTLLSFRNIRHGYCLYYVWQAYKAHGARTGRNSPTALDAWYKSDGKHAGDRNPPAGVPVFFGAKPGSSAGDVVISLGNGRVAATDYPRYGVVGECTIDERQRQIGRPYLGWTERIFDAAIDFQKPSSGGTKVNATTENRQRWLNESRGEKLKVDGIEGPKTVAAYKRYQKFLKVSDDGKWGPQTQKAHQKYYDSKRKPSKPSSNSHTPPKGEYNPFGIKWSVGLQKIARLYGYSGRYDAKFGARSMSGFAQFLRRNWGYSGNDVLGPNMWKAIQRWLKAKYGYKGAIDGIAGSQTRDALYRAESANYKALK